MLHVFGDESYDSQKRVFAIGCLIGTSDQWDALRAKWSARTEGLTFHSADCESGYSDFKNIPEADRHRLHRDLTRVLADSGIVGLGTAMNLAACKEEFPGAMPDQPHHSCFARTIVDVGEKAFEFIGEHMVEFTFDRHRPAEFNLTQIYDQIVGSKEWVRRPKMGESLLFASRREIGIQAADLWVREFMKQVEGDLFRKKYVSRPQWRVLYDTKRFWPMVLMAEHYKDLKRQMGHLKEETGVNENEYGTWLRHNRLQENQSNRIRYLEHISAMGRYKRSMA